MKDLIEIIEEDLRAFFDDEDVTEEAEDAIYERITDLTNDIEDLIEVAASDIKSIKDEFDPENIKAEIADRKSRDEREKSLFE